MVEREEPSAWTAMTKRQPSRSEQQQYRAGRQLILHRRAEAEKEHDWRREWWGRASGIGLMSGTKVWKEQEGGTARRMRVWATQPTVDRTTGTTKRDQPAQAPDLMAVAELTRCRLLLATAVTTPMKEKHPLCLVPARSVRSQSRSHDRIRTEACLPLPTDDLSHVSAVSSQEQERNLRIAEPVKFATDLPVPPMETFAHIFHCGTAGPKSELMLPKKRSAKRL
jgi:hypothetical protein